MIDENDIINSIENADKKTVDIPKKLTVLPLRDIIIYPYMIFPILIGRSSSLKAVANAVERDKFIFVTAQKNPAVEEPVYTDLYKHGTIARIMQVLRLPNNLLKVLIEGLFPGQIKRKYKSKEFLEAEVQRISNDYDENDKELRALIRHTSELFTTYVKNNSKLPPDIIGAYENIDDPVKKLYYAAANVNSKLSAKQKILEKKQLARQYFELSTIISSELELLELEDEIDTKIHDTIQKTQKKYYIQEQIRALQKELGDDDDLSPEIAQLREGIEKARMPKSVHAKANEELERLKKTPSMSPEFSVNRTYIESLIALPWVNKTQDDLDIRHVEKILDEDHYDLEKPKERILEFISVLNFVENLKRQIICFVGPPGVGKTSLARSIARALGRKFVRFSLGGIRDEAEIRGHRRTYIGAMPGKIIQSMKKAGTVNPVILLDEVDKMSMDFRGDPSSALLEVLDPEQNIAFNDHYMEVDYDLSNVLFITTANVRYDIPLPLQDRMEIIELNSYQEPEKLMIAKKHIIPKLRDEYGMSEIDVGITDDAILKIIREYTREAGVRNIERNIASVFRKLAMEIVKDYDGRKRSSSKPRSKALRHNPYFKKSIKGKAFEITPTEIEKYLKIPLYKFKREDLSDKVGVATGLAWTSTGGEILPVEVTMMPGADKLILTGKLGDVMKESARAALSYVRANTKEFGISEKFFDKNKEIHIHVPEGAIPKDGPSAGITMTIALISAATGRPAKGDVAMTGEVTLRGNILPIGGLKEKLLAAKRIGIKTVLVPAENKLDIEDISEEIRKGLDIHLVENIKDAIPVIFGKKKRST